MVAPPSRPPDHHRLRRDAARLDRFSARPGLATILFFAATFFRLDRFIQNIGYASRFGWVIGWAGLLALARGLEDTRPTRRRSTSRPRESPSSRSRPRLSPAILVFVHILSGAQTALALGCGVVAVWIDRGATREQRRSPACHDSGGGRAAPGTLGFRLGAGTGVGNPLFDHIYGLLTVAPVGRSCCRGMLSSASGGRASPAPSSVSCCFHPRAAESRRRIPRGSPPRSRS